METPRQIIQYVSSELLEQGGKNPGCVVEPEEFQKRINSMPEEKLRKVLQSLDWFLDKTRRMWEIED